MRGLSLLLLCACGRLDFDPRVEDAAPPEVPVTACTSGQRLAPIMITNASESALTDACSLSSALARDGLTAGLDRGTALCGSDWDPDGSCGCLAADLGAVYRISLVAIVEAPVTQACGTACTTPDCGTGHGFGVGYGTSLTAPTKLQTVTYDGTGLVELDVAGVVDARYLFVCREAYSATRDDIAIDYLDAICN